MKTLLIASLALALVACTDHKKDALDDTVVVHPGSPPAEDSVIAKIPPDSLVNEKGEKCVVRPAPKYDAIQLGDSYKNCGWK